MAFQRIAIDVLAFLIDKVPYGTPDAPVSYEKIELLRGFAAAAEFRNKNCRLVGLQ
ncbi:hypothetical protein D3C83_127240 [compost metagenome]